MMALSHFGHFMFSAPVWGSDGLVTGHGTCTGAGSALVSAHAQQDAAPVRAPELDYGRRDEG